MDRSDASPSVQTPCVLALGNFDGVHTGHAALLCKAKQVAEKLGASHGIYTFRVNTKKCLGTPDFALLTTDDEKNHRFEKLGMDFVCYDDFDAVRDYSPEEFCEYLQKHFCLKAVVCGENFTFGKKACGDSMLLRMLFAARAIETHVLPNILVDGKTVSSTVIRRFIREGDMEQAERFLGYRYFIRAKVVHGAHLGTKLGFPTVNQLEYGGKAVPKFGVYVCLCTVDEKKYAGVINIGIRPTVSSDIQDPPVVYETHILDFDGDLYGKTVKIEFCKMLREEKKFDSLDELFENVQKNIAESRAFFEGKASDKE